MLRIRTPLLAYNFILAWLIMLALPVHAATTTLQTCDATELIAAVNAAQVAPGPDTIDLKGDCTGANAYQLNTPMELNNTLGNSGLPAIITELTINGNGATITRATGTARFRLLFVDSAGNLTLNNLTMSNGQTDVDANGNSFSGGGIYVNGGHLTLNGTTVTDNTTGNGSNSPTGQGGDAGRGAGIYSTKGIVVLNDSSVTNNRAGNGGASNGTALSGGYGGSGGGIFDFQGVVTLNRSTISHNIAGNGGDSLGNQLVGGYGGSGGGLNSYQGTITLDQSNVNHNVAGNGGNNYKGGGYGGAAGGIAVSDGALTIRNQSEISNNQAGAGGNSSSENGGYGGSGGGLYSVRTTLTVADSQVDNNGAGHPGATQAVGKIMWAGSGGGIYVAYNSFTLTRVTVSRNRAGNSSLGSTTQSYGGDGGGLYIENITSGQPGKISESKIISNTAGVGDTGGAGGGVLVSQSDVLIDHTTIQANRAGSGRLAGGRGGAFNLDLAANLTLTQSTLSLNRSGDASDAAGQGGEGGAIARWGSGTLTVANVTFSGNQAGNATGANGNGGNGGALANHGTTVLTNVTLSGNQAGNGTTVGVGSSLYQAPVEGSTTLYNTLLAGSTPDNCNGAIGNGSNNLDDGAACGFGAANGSVSNTNAGLDPRGLRDNGGKTQTIALLSNSPAIEAGNDTFCTGLAVNNLDQRDVTRPVGAHCDIGAFEWAKLSQSITFAALPDRKYGDAPFAINATASSGLVVDFKVSGACTLNGATLTLTGVGACTLTASQVGDAAYLAATDIVHTFTITKGDQVISFAPLADQTLGEPDVVTTAMASSGLLVVLTSNTPTVCQVNNGNITLLAAGTCTITATQTGDANFTAATPVSWSFTVKNGPSVHLFLPLVRR